MAVSTLIKRLEITRITVETDRAKTFFLAPLDGWQPVYEAGQFLTFVFAEDGLGERRSYSVSSAILCEEQLAITIKEIENGRFSRYLLDHCRPGDILYTTGFSGFFCLPAELRQYECYFFLAAGSGITPCYSLIKTLLATTEKKIILVYSNSNKRSAIFYDQLKQLQEQNSLQLQIIFLFSDNKYYQDARLSKPLLQKLIADYVENDLQKTIFYTCGPELYMQVITITLLTEGIRKDNIHRENFDSRPRLYKPQPPDQDEHIVSIRYNGRIYTVPVAWPHSILAAARINKIQLPYSCEAGRCGSCVATCTSGKIWMGYNEVLTDDELAKGKILTCQAFAVGGDAEILIN